MGEVVTFKSWSPLQYLRLNGPVTTGTYQDHFKLSASEAMFQLKAMEFCGLVRRELGVVKNGHGYQWRAI